MRTDPQVTAPTRAGFWVRHGWKFLLALVIVIGLFGIGDLISGLDADPAIPQGVTGMTPDQIREASPDLARLAGLQVRSGGMHLILIAVLWSTIMLIPFRRGETWAWWAMWTFPVWTLAGSVIFLFIELQPDQPTPPPAISGWVFFAVTALLLLATRRGIAYRR